MKILARWTFWSLMGVTAVAVFVGRDASSHKPPTFPRVRLVKAELDSSHPLVRRLTVLVLDPAGQRVVSGAKVTVRAIHAELGSALQTEGAELAPDRDAGSYSGEISLPGPGRWELTVEVVGKYIGDAHFNLDVTAPQPSQRIPEQQRPQFDIDLATLRHLAMEWGHLAGFGLWLLATGVGLLNPTDRRPFVLWPPGQVS